jgi:DNA-binding MarR family transcriptional regulator
MTLSRLKNPETLDDLLNYRLVRLVALSGAPVIRLCEGGYGISRREWRVVALLAEHGPLSPSLLAERGQLDRARTSRAVSSLVAKGLIDRICATNDRRRATVALSDSGRSLYDELFPQVAEINRRIVAVLDEAALLGFDAALEALGAEAARLNHELVTGLHADRRHGGSRRRWTEGR